MPTTPRPASPLVPFDDRTRRVLELRERIRTGRYRPDPRDVARAMIEYARTAPVIDEAPPEPAAFDAARYIVRPAPASRPQAQARAVS